MPRRSLSLWMCVAAGAMLAARAPAQDAFVGPLPPDVRTPADVPPPAPLDAGRAPGQPAAPAHAPGAREKSQGLGPTAPGARPEGARTPGPGSMFDSIARTGAALAGVLALAFGARWVAKRVPRLGGGLGGSLGAAGRAPSGVLSVLGRYPTGGGQQLVLLRLDRRVLLLSQAAGRGRGAGPAFRTLAELTDPEEVAAVIERTEDEGQASLKARFQGFLHRFATPDDYAANADFPSSRQVVYGEDGDRAELLDDRAPAPDFDDDPRGMDALSERLARYRAGRGGATWSA
ncbi:MAG: hypothetical protein IT439_08465 [Phycisphaerales bacterium]|nr:hypothetical protein [Phycisphaerales bacterium]